MVQGSGTKGSVVMYLMKKYALRHRTEYGGVLVVEVWSRAVTYRTVWWTGL